MAIFWEWGHQWHRMAAAGWLPFELMRWVGVDVTRIGGELAVVDGDYLYHLVPSAELFALLPMTVFLASAASVLGRASAARWLRAILGISGFLVLRTTCLYLIAVRSENTDRMWLPTVQVATLLPAAWIASSALGRPRARRILPDARLVGWAAGGALAAGALVFALVSLRLADRPGRPIGDRVLIDEGHSQWERTDVEMSRTSYGEGTVYNYNSLYKLLRLYYQVASTELPLDDGQLNRYDVLILKTPTRAYAPAEVDAVERFVKAGGGLILIGDHTNVFGMSSYLNPIARRFGMRFVEDATYALGSMALSYYEPPAVGRHPVMSRVPFYAFATSCTLELSPSWRSVITGYDLLTLPADYSQRSFFTEPKPQRDYAYGLFSQAAARRVGKGRVLSFTDSTTFSNFYVFLRGKPEFLLSMVEYARRASQRPMLEWIWRLLAASSACALAVLILRTRAARAPVLIGSLLVAGFSGGIVAEALARRGLAETVAPPLPREHARFAVLDGGLFYLPEGDTMKAKPLPSYWTFFTWIGRAGYVPEVDTAPAGDTGAPNIVVWLRPQLPSQHASVESLRAYLREGGTLFVCGTGHECEVTYRAMLDAEPRTRDAAELDFVAYADTASAFPSELIERANALKDEVAAASTDQLLDRAEVFEAQVGTGRVLFCPLGPLFRDDIMGGTGVVPNPAQFALFQLQFSLLDRCARLAHAAEPEAPVEPPLRQVEAAPREPEVEEPSMGLLLKGD